MSTEANVMNRDPIHIDGVPGVFALSIKSRRTAYLAWTQNLQKRSHALAHMLDSGKSSIKDLPLTDPEGKRIPPSDYTFIVLRENVGQDDADRWMARLRKPFEDKRYKLVGGARSPIPIVELNGETMTLTEAIATHRPKLKYTTAWRRLKRGWTIEQTLDMEAPPRRWGRAQK
jgi:hypothetical protein